jgi:type IV fimbrial biogenesis protein FimT
MLGQQARRRVLSDRRSARGFTLIEILISIVVLGILISMGAVSFAEWLQNQHIRSATEAGLNGLQVARTEAIRRNLPVKFVLGPGTGWTVSESASDSLIQSRAHEDGSRNAEVTTTPDGATAVTFMALGGLTTNLDGSNAFSRLDFSNTIGGTCKAAGGEMRCLRVVVSAGGSMRMCDPALPVTIPPDPRAC